MKEKGWWFESNLSPIGSFILMFSYQRMELFKKIRRYGLVGVGVPS